MRSDGFAPVVVPLSPHLGDDSSFRRHNLAPRATLVSLDSSAVVGDRVTRLGRRPLFLTDPTGHKTGANRPAIALGSLISAGFERMRGEGHGDPNLALVGGKRRNCGDRNDPFVLVGGAVLGAHPTLREAGQRRADYRRCYAFPDANSDQPSAGRRRPASTSARRSARRH